MITSKDEERLKNMIKNKHYRFIRKEKSEHITARSQVDRVRPSYSNTPIIHYTIDTNNKEPNYHKISIKAKIARHYLPLISNITKCEENNSMRDRMKKSIDQNRLTYRCFNSFFNVINVNNQSINNSKNDIMNNWGNNVPFKNDLLKQCFKIDKQSLCNSKQLPQNNNQNKLDISKENNSFYKKRGPGEVINCRIINNKKNIKINSE